MEKSVVLLGCGDVGPIHEPVDFYSTLIRPVLAAGDIRFAQCERIYSELGTPPSHAGHHTRVKPHMASIFSDCNFNIVSLASNHGLDWGVDAMLDTKKTLQKRGIQAIGVGRTLAEAREPAVFEKNGVRVAILAYCSVLKEGYAAEPNKPGVSPLRAHTSYEPVDNQTGTPPRVVTVPYEEDVKGMVDDIAKARKTAHVVVVSLHWGVHFIPKVIAEYQPIVAEAAFKAGADLILGHHPHVPKAIGVHSGKVCFYSLGTCVMTTTCASEPGWAEMYTRRYGVTPDTDEYPFLPFGPDSKRSLFAKALLTQNGVSKVSFLPVLIDKQLRPEVLRAGDAHFADCERYMNWVSDAFDHKFTADGDELVITGK